MGPKKVVKTLSQRKHQPNKMQAMLYKTSRIAKTIDNTQYGFCSFVMNIVFTRSKVWKSIAKEQTYHQWNQ